MNIYPNSGNIKYFKLHVYMCQKSRENDNFYISKWELYFSNKLPINYTYVKNAVNGYVFISCMKKEGYICIANYGKRYLSFKREGWSF